LARVSRSGIGFAALALLAAMPAEAARKAPPPQPVAAAPVVPSVRSGVEMWRIGDYAGAVAVWGPFANADDMDALFNMGQAYKLGRAVPKDLVIARDYYRRAAVKGHLPAQANLGILLFQAGEKAEALRWLKAASDKNEMRAQYVLGVALWNGDGLPRNLTLAYAYLTRASAQGLAEATSSLNTLSNAITAVDRSNGTAVATSLATGNGVPPEFAGPLPRTTLASNDSFNRDLLIKPLPKLATETTKPAVARTVPNSPQPVAAPPPLIARAQPPLPAKIAPAVAAPVMSKPVVTASIAPEIAKTKPQSAVPAAISVTLAPSPAPTPGEQPQAPVVTAVPIPAATPPVPVQLPLAKPVQVAISATTVPKVIAKPAEKPLIKTVTKPSPLKPTSWRVQLGAFSKKAQAEAAWTEVKTKQKQLVAGKNPIYEVDGSVTKLQLGPFAKQIDARDACAKIAFSGRACFVTEG
jgi:hypothetical protein